LVLLAYYVAAVNIEATYNALAPAEAYEPFPGIVLTDTFQTSEDDDRYDDEGIFGDNNQRVKDQNALDIRIIVGNPPYSSGQDSANDNNQNLKYPSLDKRIADTYAARSTAQNKNSLYDSYIRAIRWASDRIKDRGIVAFVTNGGFLEGNTADGLRLSLQEEFTELYILNLRGNQRTAGEQSRREGGKVFGAGSRATIVISLLVRNPERRSSGTIHYRDIGDYLTTEQKLALVNEYSSVGGAEWVQVDPNKQGDWVQQRNAGFAAFLPLGDKAAGQRSVFTNYSAGVKTNRDAWVYNSSIASLSNNASQLASFYKSQIEARAKSALYEFSNDETKIAWGGGLRALAEKGADVEFDPKSVRVGHYRPFQKQWVVFETAFNERRYQLPGMFPRGLENYGFVLTSPSSHFPTFEALMVDQLPDLHTLDTGQFFPRYTYELEAEQPTLDFGDDAGGPTRQDNIATETLARYRKLYGAHVTADDVFFAVYGLLHSQDYRTEFAADLKKMLPRIPDLAVPEDFRAFAAAGRALSELHLGYESVEPYPVIVTGAVPEDLQVTKMRFGGKPGAWDKSTVRVTDSITVTGIPDEAHEYMLGSRSAIEWVLERHQVTIHKASGIKNDPNDWGREHGEPLYILDLLKRIVTVSVETVRIVKSLPPLVIAD
jgi:predicted helicase